MEQVLYMVHVIPGIVSLEPHRVMDKNLVIRQGYAYIQGNSSYDK